MLRGMGSEFMGRFVSTDLLLHQILRYYGGDADLRSFTAELDDLMRSRRASPVLRDDLGS